MESTNKKIVNATKTGKFKSMLEAMTDRVLREHGFNPLYEEVTFTLVKGFRPTAKYYTKDRVTRGLKLDKDKIRDMTWTPDFTFIHNGNLVIVECKGFEAEHYPLKRKLFRKYMEEHQEQNIIFFEVFTKKQVLEAINIIKEDIKYEES